MDASRFVFLDETGTATNMTRRYAPQLLQLGSHILLTIFGGGRCHAHGAGQSRGAGSTTQCRNSRQSHGGCGHSSEQARTDSSWNSFVKRVWVMAILLHHDRALH